ncbi:MAG: VCBS repeat-containing protein, partial [Planctomycetales bacterium]|nr:VCBS repeat-containing protein [Planctomycetales bacterium]
GEIDFLLEAVSDTQILLANGGSYVRATLPGTELKFTEGDLDGSAKILSIGVHGQLQNSSVTQDLAVTTSVIHQRYSRPVAADFDNDGQPEFLTYRGDRWRPVLAVTEAAAGENHITVNEDYISGQFPSDVNGDGWVDIAVMSNRSFTWFANQRGTVFEVQPAFDFERSLLTQLADLDNDGDLDILRHVGSQGIVWNENLDDHFGANQLLIDVESRVQQIVVFDANQDGLNELLVTFPSGFGQLHLGIGHGAIAAQPILLDIPWTETTAVDLDQDGRIDLLGDNGQWSRNSGHAFAEAVRLIPETHIAEVKDYDHDGDLDLAVDHYAGWRENNGHAEFSVRYEVLPPEFASLEPSPIDLNLDGIDEFVVTNPDIGIVESKLTYDFNADGRLSVSDLQSLQAAIRSASDELRFDVNHDGRVSRIDGVVFVETILQLELADVNADGVFDSADLVQMFQSGQYEQDVLTTWSQGDLNLDNRFDSADLVIAFQRSRYRQEG